LWVRPEWALKKESILSELLHRMATWWRAIALLAAVALAAGIAQTSFGHEVLRKAGLFQEPTSYTSLAFLDPRLNVIENLSSRQVPVPVSFEIHNSTGVPRYYRWSVLLMQSGRTHSVAAGGVHLTSGRGAAITRSVNISCRQGRVRVIVKLVSPAEFIDAWMACYSPRS
jgi:hypothetical protein